MAQSNLVLQLLITAKDEASAAFGKLFGYLDDNTKVIAGKIREAFTNLFDGGIAGAAELEAQLDRVAAKGGYTASEVNELKKAAQQLGAQFGISGVEAAKGMESLAAAGLSASDAIATLPQVLALAASEQISADAAAQKLIDSLSIMGLGFSEAGRMADVLAKGANITTSSASQLAEALTQAGGMARAAGMDLESAAAALDLLHKNGIKGAEAGTALKSILTALLDPASKASEELSALGISSRDLGTVLAALKDKGDAASTAILAFGTEAGPGLRALINEGQSGLDEYTAQLKNAEGAAAAAADEMGGNLQSALATLSSAWDSLKSALLDPLLPPITKQVKELAGAFQEGLSSDKFKAVQETIKAFGEASAKAIGDFVASFNFAGAMASLADFATGAKDHFDTIAKAGSIAANTVTIAWNSVTAGVKTIGAAMMELVGSVVATLANVEDIASKIGLGSAQRAAELRQKALDMQETAKVLLSSVQQDAAEMGAAFDRINEKAGETTQKIKEVTEAASIPPDALALEPIKKSLTDYQGLLERARIAQQDAAQAAREAEKDYIDVGLAMASGAVHASTYEAALKKDQAAQAALKTTSENLTQASSEYNVALQEAIRSIGTESAAAEKSIQTKKALYDASQLQVATATRVAEAYVQSANAAVNAAEAELALARAKGDQQAIAEAAVKVAERELAALQAKRLEQEKELQNYQNIADRIADLTRRKDILDAADQTELAALQQKYPAIQAVVAGREADIVATDRQIAKQEQEIAAAQRAAGPIGQLLRLYEQKTDAVERETAAVQRSYADKKRDLDTEIAQAEAKGDTVKASELKVEKAQLEAEAARALADALAAQMAVEIDALEAKKLDILASDLVIKKKDEEIAKIDELIAKKREQVEAAKDTADQAAAAADGEKKAAEATKTAGAEAEKTTVKVKAMNVAWAEFGGVMASGFGIDGIRKFNMVIGDIQRAIDQANTAAQRLADEGLGSIAGGANNAAIQVESMAQALDDSQSYLNDAARAASDNLRTALKQARSEAEGLAQSMADMAEDFRREILQMQGDQRALAELDYQDNLAKLEELHQRAGSLADAEYQQARQQAETLHRLKLQQLADETQADQTAKTTTRVSQLADEAERASRAMASLSSVNLSTLASQSGALATNFSNLNGVL